MKSFKEFVNEGKVGLHGLTLARLAPILKKEGIFYDSIFYVKSTGGNTDHLVIIWEDDDVGNWAVNDLKFYMKAVTGPRDEVEVAPMPSESFASKAEALAWAKKKGYKEIK